MNYTKQILGCMKFDRYYRQDELSAMTDIPIESIQDVCKRLEAGGIVTGCADNKIMKRKERKFKSKQRELFVE